MHQRTNEGNHRKQGRDWLIPALEDRPSRGYESVQYFLTESIQIDKFPHVSAAESIYIHQDDSDKSVFKCSFVNFKTNLHQGLLLDRKEVEELELALISSGKAQVGSKVQFVPSIIITDEQN